MSQDPQKDKWEEFLYIVNQVTLCRDCKLWQKHDCAMKLPQRCRPDDGCTRGKPK